MNNSSYDPRDISFILVAEIYEHAEGYPHTQDRVGMYYAFVGECSPPEIKEEMKNFKEEGKNLDDVYAKLNARIVNYFKEKHPVELVDLTPDSAIQNAKRYEVFENVQRIMKYDARLSCSCRKNKSYKSTRSDSEFNPSESSITENNSWESGHDNSTL